MKIHAWLDRHADVVLEPVAASNDVDLLVATLWHHEPALGQDPLQTPLKFLNTVATGAGLFLGVTVCTVALTYTGAYPVNLLLLLAILVGLPTLTLIISVVSRLGWQNRTPAVTNLLARHLARIDKPLSEYLELNLWRYGSVLYWQGQRVFQRFTIAYLTGALIIFGWLIAFSDIAFGWSSTLELEPSRIFRMTEFLSAPWQAWLPIAVPSFELVEASRFFRMNPDNDPLLLGQWWPFVGMCILVWALVPRILMATLAAFKNSVGIHTALLNHPEVTALISHLRGSTVVFPDADTTQDETVEMVSTSSGGVLADAVIVWNEADAEGLHIAVGASLAEYEQTFSRLPQGLARVSIVVKGWEPPVLEFLDFLTSLRQRVGEQVTLVVHPQALPSHPLEETDIQAWRTTLASLGDANVYIETAS